MNTAPHVEHAAPELAAMRRAVTEDGTREIRVLTEESTRDVRTETERQANARHEELVRRWARVRRLAGERVPQTFGVRGGIPQRLDAVVTLTGSALCVLGWPTLGVLTYVFGSVFVPFLVHLVLDTVGQRINRALERVRLQMADVDVDAYFAADDA